jgi:hypothetical protein
MPGCQFSAGVSAGATGATAGFGRGARDADALFVAGRVGRADADLDIDGFAAFAALILASMRSAARLRR